MKHLRDKTILVTGGTGSIGSEIVRQLLRAGAGQVRIYSRDEHKQHELKQELGADPRLRYLLGDIRDRDRLEYAMRGVDIVFHAAALKHVPFCEYNPFEAVKTNVTGTQNVIDAALKHNIEKVVAVSTDKAVNPKSVLGASKLMMERLVTAANAMAGTHRTKFACVRFGNVLHSRGSVIHLWRRQIAEGGPVTVTDRRAVRFFMEVEEAVRLIFDAAELMKGGEIFVLKMKRRSVLQFAKDTIKAHAGDRKVAIAFVGLRPGEKLDEALLTESELPHTVEAQNMFIIIPEDIVAMPEREKIYSYKGAKKARRSAYVSRA